MRISERGKYLNLDTKKFTTHSKQNRESSSRLAHEQ